MSRLYRFVLLLAMGFAEGCCGPRCQFRRSQELFTGGGEDLITVDLPFADGYRTLCTQGAGGATSHHARSTLFDVDLDTPNDRQIEVYAPAAGVAYAHVSSPTRNFGNHLNLDLGDGTYLISGHLDTVLVPDGSEVARGQLIGLEGSTGASSGDHLHFGRHAGDAWQDGIYGTSIEGLELAMRDPLTADQLWLTTSEMVCGLSGGRSYQSVLSVPRWHPEGSLVQLPQSSTVYVVEGHSLRPFLNESVFLSYGYSFQDVAMIGGEEAACYGYGQEIRDHQAMSVVRGSGRFDGLWLLVDQADGKQPFRLRVPQEAWQEILATWGMSGFSGLSAVPMDSDRRLETYPYYGEASFRDGSLVQITGQSAVYVMKQGFAIPIETWEAYLLLGFEPRPIHRVSASAFDVATNMVGDCRMNYYCLTRADVLNCDAPSDLVSAGEDQQLRLTWQAPDGMRPERVTLSGEVTHHGVEQNWYTYAQAENVNEITVSLPLERGDSLRFSVEYQSSDGVSWSCLGPFPPGTVQGSFIIAYDGEYLPYTMVDDPTSNGCGLLAEIP